MEKNNNSKIEKAEQKALTNMFMFTFATFLYIIFINQNENNNSFSFCIGVYGWVITWIYFLHIKPKLNKRKLIKKIVKEIDNCSSVIQNNNNNNNEGMFKYD